MAPSSTSATGPATLVFSIGDELQQSLAQDMFAPLLGKFADRSSVKHARNAQTALDLINNNSGDDSTPTPRGVFVTDPSILDDENRAVSDELVRFARAGGTVILGGVFSSFVHLDELPTYFNTKWGLPWKVDSYHRTTVALNRAADGLPDSGTGNSNNINSLPLSYSQKAVFLANVDNKAAWYLPTEDSVLESRVFPPDPVSGRGETPVAFVKVGNGWLGYVGDVNAEKESDDVVLGMLGLL